MTGPGVTEQMKLAVLRAMPLPPAWVTARQVYDRIDTFGLGSIKQALLLLSREGKVAKFGPVQSPAFRRTDLPQFPMDDNLRAMVRQYQDDLAEWKGKT